MAEFTFSSPKADNKPAPYALISPFSRHKPNSIVNQYNFNNLKFKLGF